MQRWNLFFKVAAINGDLFQACGSQTAKTPIARGPQHHQSTSMRTRCRMRVQVACVCLCLLGFTLQGTQELAHLRIFFLRSCWQQKGGGKGCTWFSAFLDIADMRNSGSMTTGLWYEFTWSHNSQQWRNVDLSPVIRTKLTMVVSQAVAIIQSDSMTINRSEPSVTLLETNSRTLPSGYANRKLIFKPLVLGRVYVSYEGCKHELISLTVNQVV